MRDYISQGVNTVEDVEDLLIVMRRKEMGSYRPIDYLAEKTMDDELDESWRQRMCEWMYGVVDHCNFRRDVVAVATAYLDMCLSIDSEIINSRQSFQLSALATLYLAMKVYDTSFVKVESMIKLGRGLFKAADVLEMERRILFKLQWRVHPPTAMCFLRQYTRLIPTTVFPSTSFMITEISRFIIEISICLYKFITCPPSLIAFAAVAIAADGIDDTLLPRWQRKQMFLRLEKAAEIPKRANECRQIVSQLRISFEKNVDIKSLMNTIDPNCRASSPITERDGFSRKDSPKDVYKVISI
mmetsp:Transcript_11140/g.17089  ORF Transcript_11140/g.17089 Transcript_11140/m.17089 type:complete len:299 (+) Transcript_11140:111-1007(+)